MTASVNSLVGIIFDKRMPMSLKTQVPDRTMATSLYGVETWAVKEKQVKKLEVVEMRYVLAIDIRKELKVAEMREKIR